ATYPSQYQSQRKLARGLSYVWDYLTADRRGRQPERERHRFLGLKLRPELDPQDALDPLLVPDVKGILRRCQAGIHLGNPVPLGRDRVDDLWALRVSLHQHPLLLDVQAPTRLFVLGPARPEH